MHTLYRSVFLTKINMVFHYLQIISLAGMGAFAVWLFCLGLFRK